MTRMVFIAAAIAISSSSTLLASCKNGTTESVLYEANSKVYLTEDSGTEVHIKQIFKSDGTYVKHTKGFTQTIDPLTGSVKKKSLHNEEQYAGGTVTRTNHINGTSYKGVMSPFNKSAVPIKVLGNVETINGIECDYEVSQLAETCHVYIYGYRLLVYSKGKNIDSETIPDKLLVGCF